MQPTSFAELGLSAKVLAAIGTAGYTSPTPIQAAAIPVAVTGRDVLGIAQTGTGKTASFVLPMLTRLEAGRARARMPRSLILAPTRELAAQVAQAFETYGKGHKFTVALLIGGVSFDDQIKKLDRGVDVLIATPGRLLDHFQRGRILMTGVEILVIDEADRMLDMGFIPDIERICKLLPTKRQTLFFSATMPAEIQRLVSTFLTDPARIEVAPPATTAKTITQRFCFCANGEDWAKREVLRGLIASQQVKNAIIFCNRKRDVAILFKSLVKHGFSAGALHGDMDQTSRMATLDAFRKGEIMLLAASDVAARGLDIPDVSHVFNFDMPWDADDYVHRIGRTGRAGKEGFAATLVTSDDLKVLADIEKRTSSAISWIGEPPGDDVEPTRRGRRGRGGARPGGGREQGRREGGGRDRGERRRPGARPPRPREEGRDEALPTRQLEIAAPVLPEASQAEHRGTEHRGEGGPQRPRRERQREQRSPQDAASASEPRGPRPPRQRERARPQPEASVQRERPAPQRPERPVEPRPARPERREGAPVGLGDHVPAFLRRPVRAGR